MNEIIIRNEIHEAMRDNLERHCTDIASESSIAKSFTFTSFTTRSYEDEIVVSDEFVFTYILSPSYDTEITLQRDLIQTIEIATQAVIIDKGDFLDQISLVKMGMVRVMQKTDFSLLKSSELRVTLGEWIDLQKKGSSTRYVSTGIKTSIRIGV